MPINLKNYSSTVPAHTSISNIEKCLVQAGATDISKKYNDQVCVAIQFRMVINTKPIFFKLPARVNACYNVLWSEIKRPNADTKARIMAQAERTAWKIISDWVQIQLSMIHLEQAEIMQVFLPYVFNPNSEQTFYDQLKETGFTMLGNG